jgi:hypothetical protein
MPDCRGGAGVTDVNSISLGIELDNDGFEPFAEPQIDALLLLLADIRQRYHIPAANFIGHADVAPTRKNDPSVFFLVINWPLRVSVSGVIRLCCLRQQVSTLSWRFRRSGMTRARRRLQDKPSACTSCGGIPCLRCPR